MGNFFFFKNNFFISKTNQNYLVNFINKKNFLSNFKTKLNDNFFENNKLSHFLPINTISSSNVFNTFDKKFYYNNFKTLNIYHNFGLINKSTVDNDLSINRFNRDYITTNKSIFFNKNTKNLLDDKLIKFNYLKYNFKRFNNNFYFVIKQKNMPD